MVMLGNSSEKFSVNKIKFGAVKLANYNRVLVGEFTLYEMF